MSDVSEEIQLNAPFIHLHTHSEYSVLDATPKVKHLISKAKEYGMNAIALTDHGSLYGMYDFYKEAHDQGLKPIFGCELNVANKSRFDKNAAEKSYAVVALAKNFKGLENLVKLVSFGHLEGFYYRPRVDRELLEKYSENIIILSGHEYNELTSHYILGDIEKAEAAASWYKQVFKENYYIEIVRTGDDHEEEINNKLIALAKKLDIQIVAAGDIHYMVADDYLAREVALAIADGKKFTDPTRKQDKTHQFYFKSPDEMLELWKDYPEAVSNAKKIADSCEDYKIGYGKVEPKSIDVPEGLNAESWLKKLAYEGALTHRQFINEDNEDDLQQRVIDRLEYELGIINNKDYNNYFLVVREYVKWANDNGIPTTCRGSGASSLVAYCIGITPLDPLRWKLPFERFLNPERESFPDFDIDFADNRRAEVFEHMRDKYGAENTCNIGAIGRMKSRAIIKDVGRVLGVPLSVTDKLTKLVTVKFGKPASLKEMMDPEKHPEFAQIVNESEDLQKMISMAQKLENNMRQVSTHACGFLYVPQPVWNYVPLQRESKGDRRVITQIEGGKMENLGLMKFDFLGIANLTTIAIAVKLIEKNHGVKINARKLPEDDKKAFILLQKADTAGVFQLESDGMRKYLKDLKPTTVEDISFMCAAYRPGPMQFIEPYIKRKHGKEKVTYPHEVLKVVLEETYGYAIYQEQVMEIARVFAGYTLGAADMLRRAMGKKIKELMEKEKQNFIAGSQKMGHTAAEAEQIFSYLEPFADYGFNKAHSAAYSMIAYQTAFLKANYTIEFIAALMQTDIEKADKLTRDIIEAQQHDIEVLPPNINKSEVDFSIEEQSHDEGLGGKIRFGLGGLKTVGMQQVEEIIKMREDKPFVSLDDFLARVSLQRVSKNAVEVLIKVGAMDDFGSRGQLLTIFEKAYEDANKLSKSSASATLSMFGEEEILATSTKLPDVADIGDSEKVEWEKEYMGIYFSVHPLSKIKNQLKKEGFITLTDCVNARKASKVQTVGVIKTIRTVLTKKDNKKMCFGTLEDPEGTLDFTVFPQAYEKYGEILHEGKTYKLSGKKDVREEKHGILVEAVNPVDFNKYDLNAVGTISQENNQSSVGDELPVQVKIQEPIYEDTVPESVLPVVHHEYSKVNIIVPENTDVNLLKELNGYIVSNQGNAEVMLTFKSNTGEEKKMILNAKLKAEDNVEEKIQSIISAASVSFL